MGQTSRSSVSALVVLCLGFTGSTIARADQSQIARDHWVEDPFEPHRTDGAEVRLGSVVGIVALDGKEYTALGAVIAAGHRWGRLAVDAEYGYLEISERGPSPFEYGYAHQLGVNVRYDVLRLGSRVVGPNSMAGLYVEGHVGRQLRDPFTVAGRGMPGGSSNQVGAGFGVMFDHRLEQPRGFPNRVGWQLGWRVLGAPRPAPDGLVTCRGSECAAAKMTQDPMEFGVGETSLVLGSSMAFTW
jgi:hypothetical protein